MTELPIVDPEFLYFTNSTVIAPGLAAYFAGGELDRGLAPPKPPRDFVERMRRELEDEELTIILCYPEEDWRIGAGTTAMIGDDSAMVRKRVLAPSIPLKRLDGTKVIGRDILDPDAQYEAILFAAGAFQKSRTFDGKETGLHRRRDWWKRKAKQSRDAMRSALDGHANDAEASYEDIGWQERKRIRDEYSDGSRTREDRIRDERYVERQSQLVDDHDMAGPNHAMGIAERVTD